MSASAVPFHLRPHKSVDRRLFVDLLARYERWQPIANYAYVSMGAYALEDHKLVHRRFGISRLVAFDRDENTVARQKFNRPIGSCCCLNLDSGQMIDELENILEERVEAGVEGVVIWLDYTEAKELGAQIGEFQELLRRLAVGDVIRITVNAHAPALGSARDNGALLNDEELRKKRFDSLKGKIGDYLPSDASERDVGRTELPVLLARAFGQAATEVVPAMSKNTFSPLSIVSYADGQRMLSITGVLVERDREDEMRSKIDLKNWPFRSSSWECMWLLDVPDLTVRERMFLERMIDSHPEEIAKGLGFDFGRDMDVMEFVHHYRMYFRFYPSLVALEV